MTGSSFEIENVGGKALDINVLYVDARKAINCIVPQFPGESGRVPADGRVRWSGKITEDPLGDEHLVFVGALVLKNTETADFCFLQQVGLTTRGWATPSQPDAITVADLFREAGNSEATLRGLTASPPIDLLAMKTLSWKVALPE